MPKSQVLNATILRYVPAADRCLSRAQRLGISDDVPSDDVVVVSRLHNLVDFSLEEGGDIVAMLLDHLARDEKGPCIVVVTPTMAAISPSSRATPTPPGRSGARR